MNNKGIFTIVLALTFVIGLCSTLIILVNREEHKRTVTAIITQTAPTNDEVCDKEEAVLVQVPELVGREEAIEKTQTSEEVQ